MRRVLLFFALVGCGRTHFDLLDARNDAISPIDGATCGQPVPTTGLISGSIGPSSGSDDSGSCGGAGSTENVFAIDVPVDNSQLLVATDDDLGNSINTVLYVRTGCAATDPEVTCDNDGGIQSAAANRFPVNAGHYIVTVDGEGGASGVFHGTVNVLLPPGAACDQSSFRDLCAPEYGCATTCLPANCAVDEDLMGSLSYARTVVTTGKANFHAGTCGEGHDGGVRAPEVIKRLVLAAPASNVHISTDNPTTSYDSLLYLRDGCLGTEVACNDDSGTTGNNSIIDTGPLAAGTYYLFIDGFSLRHGTADLTITITP